MGTAADDSWNPLRSRTFYLRNGDIRKNSTICKAAGKRMKIYFPALFCALPIGSFGPGGLDPHRPAGWCRSEHPLQRSRHR
jgi:hypothetical protein